MTASNRDTYSIAREPVGGRYRQLLDVSLQYGTILLLVVRNNLGLDERGSRVLTKLGPHLIDVSQQTEWRGTKLLEDSAAVHRFRFNFSCAEVLKDEADRLYDWVQPVRPEDLCILRDDGTQFLTSITHERWADLTLTTDEVEEFKRQASLLAKSLRRNGHPLE